jgi:hypothetical protein
MTMSRYVGVMELGVAKVSRLYEQGAGMNRIGTYVQRWRRWVRAGLGGMSYRP